MDRLSVPKDKEFLLITGLCLRGLELEKGSFVKVKAETVSRRTSAIEQDIMEPTWNGHIFVGMLFPTTTISFRVYQPRRLKKAARVIEISTSARDFLDSGKKGLVLEHADGQTLTVDFETNVKEAASRTIGSKETLHASASRGAEHIVMFRDIVVSAQQLTSFGPLLELIYPVKEFMDQLAPATVYAAPAWAVISLVVNIMQAQNKKDEAANMLCATVLDMYALATKKDALWDYQEFKDLFTSILSLTVECRSALEEYVSKNYIERLASRKKEIDTLTAQFNGMRRQFQNALSRSAAVAAHESLQLLQNQEREELLKSLRPCDAAVPGPLCYEGTRVDAITEVMSWIDSKTSTVLWLNGPAGVGKSTALNTIADSIRKSKNSGGIHRLGGHIRCGKSGAVFPGRVIPSLAFYIATRSGSLHLADAIAKARKVYDDVLERSLKEQMEILILQPLRSVKDLLDELHIVALLDALDECGNREERHELLEVLRDGFGKDLPNIRLVLTSRRMDDIISVFVPEQSRTCHSIGLNKNRADVELYLARKLQGIKDEDLPPSFTRRVITSELSERADGLFIWAKTAFRFVMAYPRVRLPQLLQEKNVRHAEQMLDNLYTVALDAAIPENGYQDDVKRDIMSFIGTVLAEQDHLELCTMNWMVFADNPRAESLLDRLYPVLDVSSYDEASNRGHRGIRLLHRSIQDFLTDPDRSREGGWHIDISIYRTKSSIRRFQVATSIMASVTFPPSEEQLRSLYGPRITVPKSTEMDDTVSLSSMPKAALKACAELFNYDMVTYEDLNGLRDILWTYLRFYHFHWLYLFIKSISAHWSSLLLGRKKMRLFDKALKLLRPSYRDSEADARLFEAIQLAQACVCIVDGLSPERLRIGARRPKMRLRPETENKLSETKIKYDRALSVILQSGKTIVPIEYIKDPDGQRGPTLEELLERYLREEKTCEDGRANDNAIGDADHIPGNPDSGFQARQSAPDVEEFPAGTSAPQAKHPVLFLNDPTSSPSPDAGSVVVETGSVTLLTDGITSDSSTMAVPAVDDVHNQTLSLTGADLAADAARYQGNTASDVSTVAAHISGSDAKHDYWCDVGDWVFRQLYRAVESRVGLVFISIVVGMVIQRLIQ